MTTNIPLPSTQIVTNVSGPRMRFLYPLAAACVAAIFLTPTTGEAQSAGGKLRPDQERAIELALNDVEPAMRPMARSQLATTFGQFNEAQVAMMISQMMANANATPEPTLVTAAEPIATPEDIAYNRAQFEPVIRKHHAAQTKFDVFANSRLAAYCPTRDQYARFGSGWRYEQGQYVTPSALASWNVETDVQVAAEAYAPHDGRYHFDFSKVRMTFDEKAVDAAIKSACDKVHAAGRDFLAKVDPVIAARDWDGAFKLENWAQGRLEPIRTEMAAAFEKLSPEDFTEIQLAMMSGRKVK